LLKPIINFFVKNGLVRGSNKIQNSVFDFNSHDGIFFLNNNTYFRLKIEVVPCQKEIIKFLKIANTYYLIIFQDHELHSLGSELYFNFKLNYMQGNKILIFAKK